MVLVIKKLCPIFLFLIFFSLSFATDVFAEVKMDSPPGSQIIPKLSKTPNDPILFNGGVYPMWGPVCQRYTYFTYYKDKEGRPPEYIRLWFNGQWIDVQKENPEDNDYKKGVKYIYKFVPNKLEANFFFFEASNGLGKTREGIIDSPGNGPVLFEGDFLDNEIALIDRTSGKKILRYETGKEWVGGVALSDDGRFLAAKTSYHIYLFDTTKPEKPLWSFDFGEGMMVGGDVKGGVDISGDGSRIVASIGDWVFLFNKESNKPVWRYQAGNAYNVAISQNGQYLAAATAGSEEDVNTNLIILWKADSSKPLWQYHASGNFHDVSLSADGSFLAGATGCPDRRAYIFSKESNKPLVRSEMLTYDSPVSRSKITADGSSVAFNTDGGPNSSLVALFSKDSQAPLWQFSEASQRASRALGITPDGKYIGVANMQGDVFLFGKEGGQPLVEWRINQTIGALDIADDGSLIAVGGTDNKVHLLDTGNESDREVSFDEYVAEIDVSSNGQYVAAGTSGSVYFFESIAGEKTMKVFPCTTIVEPPPMEEVMMGMAGPGEMDQGAIAQFGPTEARGLIKVFLFLQKGKTGFLIGFLVSALATIIYFLVVRFNLFRRLPEEKLVLDKKIIIPLVIVSVVFLILSLVTFLIERQMLTYQPQMDFLEQEFEGSPKQESQGESVCGNNLCEPDFGETRENCPQDCSTGD